MKKIILILSLFILIAHVGSFAQNKKKNKKGTFEMPTQAQLDNYKDYLKRLLGDSMQIPIAKRDTVASIQLQTIVKRMKINSDKSLQQDDKDAQFGMLSDDMYMHMAAILSPDELQRVKDYDQREKAREDARQKEMKDEENKRNSQVNPPGYRRYGGYGGYGGY